MPDRLLAISMLVMSTGLGCQPTESGEQAIAKAFETKQAPPPELTEAADRAMLEGKAKRDAERKAKEDAVAAERAEIDRLLVLPATKPRDIKAACKQVANSHDAFMQRHLTGEALEKWNGYRLNQMQMTQNQCLQLSSIDAAACQIHALDHAPSSLEEQATLLMLECTDRFAKRIDAKPAP